MLRRIMPVLVLGCAASAGCATCGDRLAEVRDAYYLGDLATAKAKIDKFQKKHPREADVLKLERATILLAEGNAAGAEKLFREVRDRFDDLEQKDAGEGVAAMLTDDQRLAYSGEDYERVLVR